MQVTLKEIVDARDALMNLSQQRLNIKTGYNISKIIRFANKELETLTKVRQDVIERLAPQGTEVTPETNQAIMSELTEALEVTIEIPVQKVDLSSVPNLEMSARDIMLLEPFCIFETVTLE
jgi:ABC-type dipeptide/oligopeptide/nickel transport system ATPase component